VSAEVAEAMAQGIRKRARTDFGLSVTGIAGPGGGSKDKPVGLVYIALADEVQTKSRKLQIPGDRQLVRWRASQAALDLPEKKIDLVFKISHEGNRSGCSMIPLEIDIEDPASANGVRSILNFPWSEMLT